jgi:transcriptional regulator with XRE-family HTH domain
MPAAPPAASAADQERLLRLGERLREARKRQNVSATAAAEAAGLSRGTLHRIERGEPSVTIGAWAALASALGVGLDLVGDAPPTAQVAALPEVIRLDEYPQLRQLAWQLEGVTQLTPREALDLYERNWRHVDRAGLSQKETDLIEALSRTLGGGRLLV